MTPQELNEAATEMAKVGKSEAEITQFLVINNVNEETAAGAASILISNFAPFLDGEAALPFSSQEFLDSEVERLRGILNAKCEKYYDPQEIRLTAREWANWLTECVIDINLGEAPMNAKFDFGTKVRLRNSGQGTNEVLVNCGIVSANLMFFEEKERPFQELDLEAYPDHNDFKTVEEYVGAIEEQAKQEGHSKMRRRNLATLIFVKWYTKDGRLMCQGWHGPETLETVGE